MFSREQAKRVCTPGRAFYRGLEGCSSPDAFAAFRECSRCLAVDAAGQIWEVGGSVLAGSLPIFPAFAEGRYHPLWKKKNDHQEKAPEEHKVQKCVVKL